MTTVHTLASGSSGNALLLSCGESYILLDAGISCRRITAALRELGLELGSLTAILITHTHADHISGLQTLLKRCAAPVFTTERAARELSWRLPGAETRLDALDFGIPQSIGEFAVTAFPTSHDAPGSCGFRLDAAGGAVGVLTDTGYVTDEAADILEGVDLAVLEANHDIETLRSGPYPYYLKQRILGAQGHLARHGANCRRTGSLRRRCLASAVCGSQGLPGPSPHREQEVRMQKVTILCVGKLKEKFYIDAAAEYVKRLSRFCKLELVELPEERLPEDPSPAQIEAALLKEAAAIRAKLPSGAALIALCVEGEPRSSEALARQMAAWASQGVGHLVFLIGGSFGLHPSIKAEARLRLSMSPMTFPHHLARVMVLEQIYRAYQINAGTKYHK